MDGWQQLFSDLRAQSEDEAHQREARQRAEERLSHVGDQLMGDLAAHATQRAAELQERTGRVVTVEFPSNRPVNLLEDGGAKMTFLRLKTEGRSLHVYSHHQPGRAPSLHFLRGVSDEAAGGRRVSSEPVCQARPLEDERYELRALRAHEEDAGPPISVDEVVLRAFQRLLGVGRR